MKLISPKSRTRFMALTVVLLLSTTAKAQTEFVQSLPQNSSQYDAAVVSSISGRVDVFYRSTQGALIRLWGDARVPGLTYENLAGVVTSEPSAVSWGAEHSAAFVRGGDRALWYLQWDNGSATGWQSLGGDITWNPFALSTQPGQLIAFYRGTNKQLWYRELNAGTGTWSPHQSLGGVLTSSPVAVSWGPGHLAVFTRGQANDLWYRERIGSTWGPWTGLGGYFTGDPIVVSRGYGLMDLFARTGASISKISYNGSAWSGWQSIGSPAGGAVSEPAAVATTSGQLVVFARQATVGTDIYARRDIQKSVSNDGGVSWSGWSTVLLQTKIGRAHV